MLFLIHSWNLDIFTFSAILGYYIWQLPGMLIFEDRGFESFPVLIVLQPDNKRCKNGKGVVEVRALGVGLNNIGYNRIRSICLVWRYWECDNAARQLRLDITSAGI